MSWGWQGTKNPDRLILDFVLFFLSHIEARKKKHMSQLNLPVAFKSHVRGGQSSEARFEKGAEGSCPARFSRCWPRGRSLFAPPSPPQLGRLFVQRLELTCFTTVRQMLLQMQQEGKGAFQKRLSSSEKVQLDYHMGKQHWQRFQSLKTLHSLNISR